MSRLKGGLLKGAALAALLTGAIGAGAHAQAGSPAAERENPTDTIVVTATRREETLQDVPIAVSAFTGADLQELSVSNIGDVSQYTPNLAQTSGPSGGNDGYFFIRGVGQVDSNPASDPGVGVYIDEVYLGRIQGSSFDVLDIARVEVLRGPQGTLFGRNTIGGAINVVTADPGEEFGGNVRVAAGTRDLAELIASVDLPLSDTFGMNVAAFSRHQDGWVTSRTTGATYGDVENLGARIKAVWEPAETFKLTLVGDTARTDGSAAPTIAQGFNQFANSPNPGVITGGSPLGVPFPTDMFNDVAPNLETSFQSNAPISETETGGLAAIATWNLGAVTLKSITSYREMTQFVTNDFDGSGYTFFDNFFDSKQNQISQEFQMSGEAAEGRLEWLGGLYFFEEESDHVNGICQGTNTGIPGVAVRNDGRCLLNNQAFTLDVSSWAAFGNATWAFTDALSVTLGLRLTNEEKEQQFDFFLDNSAGIFNFAGIPPLVIPTLSPRNPALTIPTLYTDDWESLTSRLVVDYVLNDQVNLYASYSEGFKSGGFNGRPNPNPTGQFSEVQTYDPETLETFELGFKGDYGRVRANAALFHSIYDDIQILVIDPATAFLDIDNAGEAEMTGLELEVFANPVDPLTFMASVGYIDASYNEVNPLAAGISLNNELPVTPEWTVHLGAEYEVDLATAGALRLRADYSWRSDVFFQAENALFDKGEEVGLLNLRATYTLPSQMTSISVFGRNVTDETYLSNAQDVRGPLGVAPAQLGETAEWGVELSVDF